VPEILPRFQAAMEKIEDARKIGRILQDTGECPDGAQVAAGATAGGDARRARGVPIVCRGVRGTAPGPDRSVSSCGERLAASSAADLVEQTSYRISYRSHPI
jgi:hypothetical protein